jgi:nucleotide-binding universal stress UspA family protein
MRDLRRILVGVDFSDRSRIALGFAARLACQFGAELHVLHAQDAFLSAAAEHQRAALATETRDELRCLVAATWPASQCDLHFDVVVGRASTVIAHATERERADLIVIAAHGMSAARHALLGSTAEGVLRRANVSVFVVPDQWTPPDPTATDLRGGGPVIVGVDFRLPSLEAVADGAALASALHSELLLVHIVPTMRVLPRWREHADATLPERTIRARQELERMATAVGDLPIRVIVEPGRPAPCLTEAACVYPHGILALGRAVRQHGYAAPGTTAYRTITLSQLPTLMHVAR